MIRNFRPDLLIYAVNYTSWNREALVSRELTEQPSRAVAQVRGKVRLRIEKVAILS